METNEKGSGQVQFLGIGDDDQVEYKKADLVKACRVGSNYAIAFYQLDYQALANALNQSSSKNPNETKLMPVAKLVCDKDTFDRLRSELDDLATKVSGKNGS